MRTREAVFDLWAPEQGIWSPWVKPVAFTALTPAHLSASKAEAPRPWDGPELPDAGSSTAVVLELPAATSLRLGVALTRRGFRPIPLFNGVPQDGGAFVPTDALSRLLVTLADDVHDAALPFAAPPAFVLDADRMAGGRVPAPGQFDNRWMVFAQDFPSASFLKRQGLQRVLVVQHGSAVADDLARVLAAFREQGMEVLVLRPDGEHRPEPAVLPKASWVKSVLFRAMVTLRMRRNSAGGFGARVPEPSQTGFFA